MTLERRFSRSTKPSIETRADGKKVIVGYAAVFYREGDAGTEFVLWPGVRERIMPGAFTRALSEKQDVRGLVNHSPSQLLGRTKSGTMRLSVDEVGLRYEIDAGDTQLHRDLAELLSRGDIDGSSFGFTTTPGGVSYITLDDNTDIRAIMDCDLYDVGPVTYPAYTGTTAAVRSLDVETCKQEHDAWRAQQRQTSHEADAVAVRMRLVALHD